MDERVVDARMWRVGRFGGGDEGETWDEGVEKKPSTKKKQAEAWCHNLLECVEVLRGDCGCVLLANGDGVGQGGLVVPAEQEGRRTESLSGAYANSCLSHPSDTAAIRLVMA